MHNIVIGHGNLMADPAQSNMEKAVLPDGVSVQLFVDGGRGIVFGSSLTLFGQLEPAEVFGHDLWDGTCVNVSVCDCEHLDDARLVQQIADEFPSWNLIRPNQDGYPDSISLCDNRTGMCPTTQEELATAQHNCGGLLSHLRGQIVWIACSSLRGNAVPDRSDFDAVHQQILLSVTTEEQDFACSVSERGLVIGDARHTAYGAYVRDAVRAECYLTVGNTLEDGNGRTMLYVQECPAEYKAMVESELKRIMSGVGGDYYVEWGMYRSVTPEETEEGLIIRDLPSRGGAGTDGGHVNPVVKPKDKILSDFVDLWRSTQVTPTDRELLRRVLNDSGYYRHFRGVVLILSKLDAEKQPADFDVWLDKFCRKNGLGNESQSTLALVFQNGSVTTALEEVMRLELGDVTRKALAERLTPNYF